MANTNEWMADIKTMSDDKLDEVIKGLDVVRKWDMFEREFKGYAIPFVHYLLLCEQETRTNKRFENIMGRMRS